MLFDHWCAAKQVDNDYNKLRPLMFIEEFKKCLQSDVKMYLDEQKPDGLHPAAVLADDYSMTPKWSFLLGEQHIHSSLIVKQNVQKYVSPMGHRARHNGQDRGQT